MGAGEEELGPLQSGKKTKDLYRSDQQEHSMGGVLLASSLDALCEQSYERINVGVKPSGKLHIGSLMTFMAAARYLERHPETELEICVMDLDFDTQRGNCYVPYTHRVGPNGEGLMSDHMVAELEVFADGVSAELGINRENITILKFSEVVAKPVYLAAVKALLGTTEMRKVTKDIVTDNRGKTSTVPLAAICPDCDYSSSTFSRTDRELTALEASCNNTRCDTDRYSVSIEDTGRYGMHYLLDPIRDIFNADGIEPAGLHIFGGDYMQSGYAKKGTPKAVRVQQLVRETLSRAIPKDDSRFSRRVPDIYVGPIIVQSGRKVGKSYANGMTFEELRQRSGWVQRVGAVLDYCDNRSTVEFSEIIPLLNA